MEAMKSIVNTTRSSQHTFFSVFLKGFFLFIFLLPVSLHALGYRTAIEGVNDANVLKQLKNSSQVILSQGKGATSLKQLKNMVDTDCEGMKKVLLYNGFFSAFVHPAIVQTNDITVLFQIDLGPRYTLKNLLITWTDKKSLFGNATHLEKQLLNDNSPSVEDVSLFTQGKPVHGDLLHSFEKEFIESLSKKGFFQPKILDKKFIAHPESATVDVSFDVETGPFSTFGTVTVEGNETVQTAFILSKLTWKEGDLYNKEQVDAFESALLKTGLFQSVILDCRQEEVVDTSDIKKKLLVNVTVREGKQRTIGTGFSYTTTLGAGCSLQLEHRNIRGMGERLSFRGDIWQKMRNVTLTYTLPHPTKRGDNTLFIIEHDHQTYLPYHSSAWKGSVLRERKLSKHTEFIWGGRVERLESTRLISNRLYHLLKVPLYWKWSNANSLWDPTAGMSLNVKLTPSYQYIAPNFTYLIGNMTWSGYESFSDDTITLATRFSFGTILGAGKNSIPVPDRFFGGTENSLRGYKTGSVAPLNKAGEPIGGRSLITGTFELRQRYSNGLGSVFFYDVGNVFSTPFPDSHIDQILHSCGFGVRYTTPIGPIRLDIAFPIHRRKNIDPPFQIYFSIGQSF